MAVLEADGASVPIVLTTWGASLDRAWRASVRESLALHVRWCLLFNGTHLRVLDASRTFARRHLDFDLESTADSEATARLLVTLASAASLSGLDGINFFVAGMQAGFGPYVALYLADQKWMQQEIGFVLTAGGLAGLLIYKYSIGDLGGAHKLLAHELE